MLGDAAAEGGTMSGMTHGIRLQERLPSSGKEAGSVCAGGTMSTWCVPTPLGDEIIAEESSHLFVRRRLCRFVWMFDCPGPGKPDFEPGGKSGFASPPGVEVIPNASLFAWRTPRTGEGNLLPSGGFDGMVRLSKERDAGDLMEPASLRSLHR